MRRFRHLFLLRTVLIVLLAWTGADLLVPELCANEAPIPGVTADTSEEHGVRALSQASRPTDRQAAVRSASRTSEPGTSAPDGSTPGTPSPDDCFCCSQTVETVTLDLTLGAPTSLPLTDAPAPRFLPGVPREPFHPPLSL